MANFIIIIVCLLAGMFIRRRAKFNRHDVRPLNIVVLWLSLPALVLVEVPRLFRNLTFTTDLVWAAGMPWLQFAAALGVAASYRKLTGASLKVVGAIALTAGLANTSFVGFPIIEALYGNEGLRLAILIDQLGSFLAVSTVGLFVASACAGRSLKLSVIVRRVVFFPPFIAFCFAVFWGLSALPTEGLVVDALRRIGLTLVPLALFSVGWQLEPTREALARYWKPLTIGLGFKLVFWPLLFGAVLKAAVGSGSLFYNVTVMEAAMAPMITAAVVASEFELESDLAQLMVGIGIPLSFVTLTVWHSILGLFSS